MLIVDSADEIQRVADRLRVLHGQVQTPDRRARNFATDDFAGRHEHPGDVLVFLDLTVRESQPEVDLQ